MKKVKMILPMYVDKFRCIGGECEDNCCIGWNIDLDKETFKKYHKIKDAEVKKLIQKAVHNNPYYTNEKLDYGIIKLNKENRCPFLQENNFCLIQEKYGEDYLGSVCCQYPRVVNKIDDHYEMSIDLGCPEAARIVLGNSEKISFQETERNLGKYTMAGVLDTRIDDFKGTPIKYFKEIRDFSIKIIQYRDLDLSRRLYVLGDFINKLDDAANININQIKNIIDEYDIQKEARNYEKQDMNYVLQVSFFNDLLENLNIKNDNKKIKEYSNYLVNGFELTQNSNIAQHADKYISAFENYINECMEKNSYIFENYMVNFMYNNLFPFSESDDMFDGYIMLLLRYSLMRFYLVGVDLSQPVRTTEEIIKFIQVFSKTIEHNSNYRSDILEYIKTNGFDNIEFAKTLI